MWGGLKAAAQVMLRQEICGRIINVGSDNSRVGQPNLAAYYVSKFGLVGFAQALTMELALAGITVNTICPDPMNTERVDYFGRREDGSYDLQPKRFGGALCGTPDDLREWHPEVEKLAQTGRQIEHRPADAELMKIGCDDIWPDASRGQGFGSLVGKGSATMSDIHHYTQVPGTPCIVQESAHLVNDLHRLACKAMRENVARFHRPNDLIQLRRISADGAITQPSGLLCHTRDFGMGEVSP